MDWGYIDPMVPQQGKHQATKTEEPVVVRLPSPRPYGLNAIPPASET
jgi:hypothetical protein